MKGATEGGVPYAHLPLISIHAPVKGATPTRALLLLCPGYFNPRSREGSDPPAPVHPGRAGHFNPRSREGSDGLAEDAPDGVPISIHAPVKGATIDL